MKQLRVKIAEFAAGILVCWVLCANAQAAIRVVVPVHDIARGQTIEESDLTYASVDGKALMSGTALSIDQVKGMQARRMLSQGQPFRGDDLKRPTVVARGELITMQFEAPGVELTAVGRAMNEGGVGDTVIVQNIASYRMISATVIGPGTVRPASSILSSLKTP